MSRIIAILLSETVYFETFKHKSCGFETHSFKKENHGVSFFVYPWFLTSWFFSTLPPHG
jgi:hypothetical protein